MVPRFQEQQFMPVHKTILGVKDVERGRSITRNRNRYVISMDGRY